MTIQSAIPGVHVIDPVTVSDQRGFFARTLTADQLAGTGVALDAIEQHSHSRSASGVLRGIHLRIDPGEAKIVRCVRGRVHDVIVDLRRGSPTFGQWEAFELDELDLRALVLPDGVGHGFLVLSGPADVTYLHTSVFGTGRDLAIRWDDPDLDIAWPEAPVYLSPRDAGAPALADIIDVLDMHNRWTQG
jgi:dTDP-4-dehydrorhamnose 3,5-epimerase